MEQLIKVLFFILILSNVRAQKIDTTIILYGDSSKMYYPDSGFQGWKIDTIYKEGVFKIQYNDDIYESWVFELKNGKLNGNSKTILSDGSIRFETYKNDTIINTINFFKNGSIKDIFISYTKNLKNTSVSWFSNGQIKFISNMLFNRLDGEVKYYYNNGQVEKIENWNEGVADGYFWFFTVNGRRATRILYNDGSEIERERLRFHQIKKIFPTGVH